MDRNNFVGILLMIGLFIGYQWFVTPSAEELAAMEAAQVAEQEYVDSLRQADEASTLLNREFAEPVGKTWVDSASVAEMDEEMATRFGPLSGAVRGEDQTVTLKNSEVEAAFSTRGALPFAVTLTDSKYKQYAPAGSEGEQVQLWDQEADRSGMDVVMVVPGTGQVNWSQLHFEADKTTDSTALFVANAGSGKQVRVMHSLDGFELNTSVSYVGLEGIVDPGQQLAWYALGLSNEKGLDWERQHSSVFFREKGQGRNYLSEGREDEEEPEGMVEWVAFKQNFFSAIVSMPGGFQPGAKLASMPLEDDSTHTMLYRAELPIKASGQGFELNFYFGPNELGSLEKTELGEIGRVIDYGWWIFGWVNRNFILPLYNWLASNIASTGLIILIITVIIKMVLFPITWKNFLSSAKMRVLRPEIEAVNEKHKDDATGKQTATMALYRETGVNPLAGCLPALLQMPILYAMFRFFPANIDMRGKSFLWADDLGAYDSILQLPFSIPMYGDHVSGFTILMAASTFFYMRMTMASQPMPTQQPGMPNMKVIQQFIPFMMLFFFNRFASGLSLYYLAANLISIGQMLLIKRFFIDEVKIRAKIDANKAKPKKKSSFAQRLEEVQRDQQQKTQAIKSKRKNR